MLSISRHGPLSCHDDVALFNDVANEAESTQLSKNWWIEYQVRVFWYQVYQARLWECLLTSLGKPRYVNKHSQRPCLVNLISKHTHLVFSMYCLKVVSRQMCSNLSLLSLLLAHLSRRLMSELIVYQSLRLLSIVCPSTFSNIFSSETTVPIKFKFHMETP